MYWENKRVVVTGGAGVIGQTLIQELVNHNANVLCVDRERKPVDMPKGVGYCQVDISEMDMKPIIEHDPEIIFHLAASFERTEETPEFWKINYRDNVLVSHRMIEVARELKSLKKFIFSSSYLIYASDLYKCGKPQKMAYVLNEEDRLDTRNLTGAAKYYTEKELDFMNKTYGKFTTISARIFRVYGCGSRDIISRWVRMALNNQVLTVYQKENMFDYIYSGDVAIGLMKMVEQINQNEIVNLGRGQSRKVEDVVRIIQSYLKELQTKEQLNEDCYEASCGDMTRLNKLIQWQPQTDIEEGIKKIINYEKSSIESKEYTHR